MQCHIAILGMQWKIAIAIRDFELRFPGPKLLFLKEFWRLVGSGGAKSLAICDCDFWSLRSVFKNKSVLKPNFDPLLDPLNPHLQQHDRQDKIIAL